MTVCDSMAMLDLDRNELKGDFPNILYVVQYRARGKIVVKKHENHEKNKENMKISGLLGSKLPLLPTGRLSDSLRSERALCLEFGV